MVEPEAASDLVHHERRAELIAQLAQPAGERGIDVLLVEARVVLEGRRDDRRDITGTGLLDRALDACRVVVLVVVQSGPLFRGHSIHPNRRPRCGPVIRPLRGQHLVPAGLGARNHQRDRRGVGAVLGEDRPVGVRDSLHEQLAELHHARCRPRLGVPLRRLCRRGGLDAGMLVAEDHRAEAAHEVDVLVAVDVPHARALRALVELRVRVGQVVDVHVPVHPTRDHRSGTPSEIEVERANLLSAGDVSHRGALSLR